MTVKIVFVDKSLFEVYKTRLNVSRFKVEIVPEEEVVQKLIQNNYDYLIVDSSCPIQLNIVKTLKNIDNLTVKKIGIKKDNIVSFGAGLVGFDSLISVDDELVKYIDTEMNKKIYPMNFITDANVVANVMSYKDETYLVKTTVLRQKKDDKILINDEFGVSQNFKVQKIKDDVWAFGNPFKDMNVIQFSKTPKKEINSTINKKAIVFSKKNVNTKIPYVSIEMYSDVVQFFNKVEENLYDEYFFEFSSETPVMQKNLVWKLMEIVGSKKIYCFNSKYKHFDTSSTFFYKKPLNSFFEEHFKKYDDVKFFFIKEKVKINFLSMTEVLLDPQTFELMKGGIITIKDPLDLVLKVKKIKIINSNKICLCDILEISEKDKKKLANFIEK